ncbi:MAG: class I SAM-dependent methyltransferase [Dehalococcoidia bacterium]
MDDPYAIDARYYDLVHAQHTADIGLWLSYAGRTERPVLEMGTGTGRIAIALALAGHRVTAFDPSAAMLAVARKKAEDEGVDIDFQEGTIEQLALPPGEYGFVLVPQDVFLYCADAEAQVATLEALASCMHFNATLALDLPGPALWLDPGGNGQSILAWSGETDDGQRLDVLHVSEDDLADQARWLRVTYERVGGDGIVRREQSEHLLRYVYPAEAAHLFRLAGLQLNGLYGDYDLGPLTNDSDRMIVVAARRGG